MKRQARPSDDSPGRNVSQAQTLARHRARVKSLFNTSPHGGHLVHHRLHEHAAIGGVVVDVVTPAEGIAPENSGRLLINIHGGPESQYRPTLFSFDQFLLNEMGVAVIRPNVQKVDLYGGQSTALLDSFISRVTASLQVNFVSGTLDIIKKMWGLPDAAHTGDLSAATREQLHLAEDPARLLDRMAEHRPVAEGKWLDR